MNKKLVLNPNNYTVVWINYIQYLFITMHLLTLLIWSLFTFTGLTSISCSLLEFGAHNTNMTETANDKQIKFGIKFNSSLDLNDIIPVFNFK